MSSAVLEEDDCSDELLLSRRLVCLLLVRVGVAVVLGGRVLTTPVAHPLILLSTQLPRLVRSTNLEVEPAHTQQSTPHTALQQPRLLATHSSDPLPRPVLSH